MIDSISEKVSELEARHGVKILYACESGSRAWGFPSLDSDYDVRCIYVHPRPWYLSVRPGEDTLDETINDALDISGWALRKALGLILKSNPVAWEWLQSPIRYRSAKGFPDELIVTASAFFSPVTGFHHYYSMAKRGFHERKDANKTGIKKYFYIIRSVLAAAWIGRSGSIPPMALPELLSLVPATCPAQEHITNLIMAKASLPESHVVDLVPEIESLLTGLMSECEASKQTLPKAAGAIEGLDGFFEEVGRMRVGKTILVTEYGSTVFGTRVPTSDRDVKGIYVPHYTDILLQRVPRTSIQMGTREDLTARNTANDIDTEWVSLLAFIRLCSEGQSMALDLLFTPSRYWSEHDECWQFLIKNRSRLLTRRITAIVGYCKQQAAKYGVKGSRVAAVRHVLDVLKSYPIEKRLCDLDLEALRAELEQHKHISFVFCKGPAQNEELHLEVCNRKVSFHARIEYVLEVYQRVFDQYGQRAIQAEANQGVDWKAMMHAIRISEQAKELLTTGYITLPRPNRERLIQIRKGELPFDGVAEWLEQSVQEVESLQESSDLPESVDITFWESWVVGIYGRYVCESV